MVQIKIGLLLISAVRRRLRRPTASSSSSSSSNRVRGDQETSASVNRFKVRSRVTPGPSVLSRKSTSVTTTPKDEGYKVCANKLSLFTDIV